MEVINLPPNYTPSNTINAEEAPPDFSTIRHQELPSYAQTRKNSGWSIVIKNRLLIDGYRIFVSDDAAKKYKAFKKNKNRENLALQQQGYGVPLFKVVRSFVPFSKKFLTFRRYIPSNLHAFEENSDMYDYCSVAKTSHLGYDSYIFEFVPDPTMPWLNFRVVMFSHSILPISDYFFRGRKHRWIDESSLLSSNTKQEGFTGGFRHTILSPHQVSLTDNWDGMGDVLSREIVNPYLSDDFDRYSSLPLGSTNIGGQGNLKPEYYGRNFSRIHRIVQPTVTTTSNEVRIGDVNNRRDDVNYETIFSVDEEELVMICMATTLKRQKDIKRKIEMAAKATQNCR
ncbi:predicted protein [Candida tropicalis MYA-3404]|uniref:Uncharacterized protein n=1 Tax=Candida tropicalis (strain ATCC MYA-3404 / T1) TaxID=294747 RepID=C5M2K6_CANTT|nr:predicted protein [Candida tropicalis MYA-3404]EER35556.1 predicted protein [Candida tropicalis MYA-3404]KAG4409663.1 hypothetical protein JTP64_000301 [Candida tropicalis]